LISKSLSFRGKNNAKRDESINSSLFVTRNCFLNDIAAMPGLFRFLFRHEQERVYVLAAVDEVDFGIGAGFAEVGRQGGGVLL